METVYVVIKTYFNGEGDSETPVRVFRTENAAKIWVETEEAKDSGPCSPSFRVSDIIMENI